MTGIPDKSICQITSAMVVPLTSVDGLKVSNLVPVNGPSVIFVNTSNCSGFTVTNCWVFVSPSGPAVIVTSLSVVLSLTSIFLMALKVGQYFVSLSTFETIFQTLSMGADISRLTLTSCKVVALAWDVCHIVPVIRAVAIIIDTDKMAATILISYFFVLVIFFIVRKKGSFFFMILIYL